MIRLIQTALLYRPPPGAIMSMQLQLLNSTACSHPPSPITAHQKYSQITSVYYELLARKREHDAAQIRLSGGHGSEPLYLKKSAGMNTASSQLRL